MRRRPPIFVSYSHRDAELVRPVVALLRASEAQVFRDADNLKPGKKWREQLSTAIRESEIVFLFWCRHSSKSPEVRNEYVAALELNKDILPILIDRTALPPELAAYQSIDFRGTFGRAHEDLVLSKHDHSDERYEEPRRRLERERPSRRQWPLRSKPRVTRVVVYAGVCGAIALLAFSGNWLYSHATALTKSDNFAQGALLALSLLIVAVLLFVIWDRRAVISRPSATPEQERLALAITHELRKKRGSQHA